MDNEKTKKYRKSLDKKNFFNIVELNNMPKYFGWVDYCINNNLNIKVNNRLMNVFFKPKLLIPKKILQINVI